ncbi:MAG: hypothetical protein Q4G33_12765 [bacterium]|nr:hypothetical protein [bacterium]
MKDKQREKLKRRRRAEREEERARERDAYCEEYNRFCREHQLDVGIVESVKGKEMVYKARMKLEKQNIVSARMSCLAITLECLHDIYGFGKDRLVRVLNTYAKVIKILECNERNIYQLSDELRNDTNIDVKEIYNGYAAYGGRKLSLKEDEAAQIIKHTPGGIVECMYAVYNDSNWKWKSIRMKRIAEEVFKRVTSYLERFKIRECIKWLEDKYQIHITMDGRVWVDVKTKRRNDAIEA